MFFSAYNRLVTPSLARHARIPLPRNTLARITCPLPRGVLHGVHNGRFSFNRRLSLPRSVSRESRFLECEQAMKITHLRLILCSRASRFPHHGHWYERERVRGIGILARRNEGGTDVCKTKIFQSQLWIASSFCASSRKSSLKKGQSEVPPQTRRLRASGHSPPRFSRA